MLLSCTYYLLLKTEKCLVLSDLCKSKPVGSAFMTKDVKAIILKKKKLEQIIDARAVECKRMKDAAKDTSSLAGEVASLFQIRNVHLWYFIKEKLILKNKYIIHLLRKNILLQGLVGVLSLIKKKSYAHLEILFAL